MVRTSKTLEYSNIFSSFVMVFLLLAVLLFSLSYWSSQFGIITDFSGKMFSLALVISFVTVIAQWIQGRVTSINKSILRLKRKKEVQNG